MAKNAKLGARAGDKTTQPDGTVIEICAYCGLWVAGDMTNHVQKFCPVAMFRRGSK